MSQGLSLLYMSTHTSPRNKHYNYSYFVNKKLTLRKVIQIAQGHSSRKAIQTQVFVTPKT